MPPRDPARESALPDVDDVDDRSALFRQIPSVNELADAPALAGCSGRVPRSLIVVAAQAVLAEHRAELGAGDTEPASRDALADRVARRLEVSGRPPLPPVINGTGIVIHTGLGRAPLAEPAVEMLAAVARGYAPVELDLATGTRNRRTDIVRPLLCELTGAESATVVNNNAGAVLLALSAIARDKTVIVSRGELIEIGGSFRLPDVMEAGGATLREVGTTNKTRLRDYERAIDDSTGAIMKVHPSNYRIEGFTTAVELPELVALGHGRGLPVIHDIGSGVLGDPSRWGMADEPDARSSIAAGADVVLFSGDKLLGGPQAGIIVGGREWIEKIERDPLARALRVDKLVLAALGATLQLHRDPELATTQLPVLRMLTASREEIEARATRLVMRLAPRLADTPGIRQVRVEPCESFPGGGSLPEHAIKSAAVVLHPGSMTEDDLAERLRRGVTPVVPRVQGGAVWLDLRTVLPDQDDRLAEAIVAATI